MTLQSIEEEMNMKVWLIQLLIYLCGTLLYFGSSILVVARIRKFAYEGNSDAQAVMSKTVGIYNLLGPAVVLFTGFTKWTEPGICAYLALSLASLLLARQLILLFKGLSYSMGTLRPRTFWAAFSHLLGAGGMFVNILLHI